LVFTSPLMGVDGTSAYNDVALAAIAFTLFQLLQIWERRREARLVIAIGLVAGFAIATKYTGWLAVPYALGFIVWKSERETRLRNCVCVAFAASCVLGPWLVRNWIWFHNPLAPFFNGIFPNPYVMVSFEKVYRRMLAHYDLSSLWQIPMEVTTYGTLA